MKPSDPPVAALLRDNLFRIPIYQRSYVWTEYNWKALWKYVVGVAEGEYINHFIGSIILSEEENTENDNEAEQTQSRKEWLVIDGQQRLTTFTILVAAACHWLAKKDSNKARESLRDFKKNYLFKETDTENGTDQTLRLRPADANREYFDNLLNPLKSGKLELSTVDGKESQIYAAFNYFYKEIERYSGKDETDEEKQPARITKLIEKGLEGMLVVRIDLAKEDDAQRIFECMNHLGFRLSESDLIRNYVLQGFDSKVRIRFHNDYWTKIEKAAKDPSVKKKEDEDKVPEFFRHYLTMKEGKAVKEQGEEGVFETFKNGKLYQFKVKSKPDVDKCEIILQELSRFVGYYAKFLKPSEEKDNDIRKHLGYLQQLPQSNGTFPFLLQVFDDCEYRKIIGKPELINVLELIQSYIVRCVFCNRSRQGQNKLWAGLYGKSFKNELDKDNNVRKNIGGQAYITCIQRGLGNRTKDEMFPSRDEVTEGIKNYSIYKNRVFTKYVLLRLEEVLKGKKTDTLPNISELTIEHIFPQKPNLAWVGNAPSKVSPDDFKEIQKRHLHTLGNLTLTALNREMGNKPFAEKFKTGFQSSGLKLNEYLVDLGGRIKWDKERIIERAQWLIDKFFKVWKDIPDTSRKPQESEAILIRDVESLMTENGKPRPIQFALFDSIEIQGKNQPSQKTLNSGWRADIPENLCPEKTTVGTFYHEIMCYIYDGHEATFNETSLGGKIGSCEKDEIDENNEEQTYLYFRVPHRIEEDENKSPYRIDIDYDEMLENIKMAAVQTETQDKLKIKFAD